MLHLSEKCSKEEYSESKYTDGESCLPRKETESAINIQADNHKDKQSDKYIRKNQSITNDKIRSYAQTLKEYFAESDYPAIVSCYGDRIIGFMKDCTDDRKKIIDIFKQFGEFLQNDLNGIEYTLNIGEKCESMGRMYTRCTGTSSAWSQCWCKYRTCNGSNPFRMRIRKPCMLLQ